MTSQGNPTILLVDDEEDLLNAMSFDFLRKGFNVLTASGGHRAFELIESNKVDLVITDLNMPQGNGIELLERVKKMTATIPVLIFVSGDHNITPEQAYAKGADLVLSKPFCRKKLMAAVLDHLAAKDTKDAI